MSIFTYVKKEGVIFGCLAIYATILLFFVSSDSYTHDMYGRWDSAWFFMCGKALMNGMTPYVDYSDSKGLLLWVIYGIGYLLSPRNYLGIFWLSCIVYSFIFYLTYLTAKIYLHDRRQSLVCTILMTLAFFNHALHSETRAEDFCLLMLTASLYRTALLLEGSRVSRRTIGLSFFVLGVCFGALFMIKYNIAAMQTIFILYAAWWVIRNRQGWLRALVMLLAGISLVVVPLVAFMAIKGCLGAFVHEYFFNTMQTVTVGESTLTLYLRDWQAVFADKYRILLLLLITAGCLLWSKKSTGHRWFPLITSLFIFAVATRHALWIYYYLSCSFLLIWMFIYLSQIEIAQRFRHHLFLLAFVIGGLCSVVHFTWGNYFDNMFWNDVKSRKEFYDIQYLMSQVESPRLYYAFQADQGLGMVCHALPGGKYWAMQNGVTKAMNEEHKRELLSGVSDFVYVKHPHRLVANHVTREMLEAAGYHLCYKHGESFLLTKHNISLPDTPIHLSNWDILLKRYPAPFQINR